MDMFVFLKYIIIRTSSKIVQVFKGKLKGAYQTRALRSRDGLWLDLVSELISEHSEMEWHWKRKWELMKPSLKMLKLRHSPILTFWDSVKCTYTFNKARSKNRLKVFVGTTLSSFHSYSIFMLPVQQLIVPTGLCLCYFPWFSQWPYAVRKVGITHIWKLRRHYQIDIVDLHDWQMIYVAKEWWNLGAELSLLTASPLFSPCQPPLSCRVAEEPYRSLVTEEQSVHRLVRTGGQ